MATSFQVEYAYDVPPQALLDVLTDERFLQARSQRFGGSGDPQVDRSGDRIVVRIPRQLPVEAVPGALRRFVGDGRLVQTDTWSQTTGDHVEGRWTTDVGGAPLSLQGTHTVDAADRGSRYVVAAEVKVRIPLAGGAAENLIRQRLSELITSEQEFAASWLAGQR
jgi:hypothetical protein